MEGKRKIEIEIIEMLETIETIEEDIKENKGLKEEMKEITKGKGEIGETKVTDLVLPEGIEKVTVL